MEELLDILENPKSFSEYFLKILDKQQNLQPLLWNGIQTKFHSERTGKDLVVKSRQVGISTLAQSLIFHSAITSSQSTLTLAHDDATTQALRRMHDRYYENFPDNLTDFRKPIRKYANDTVTTYPKTNSTVTTATAGSKNIGRGMTYTFFHGSEVAFWPDAEKIVVGALQGMDKPNIILESTPNGNQGYFYQLCMDSLAGKNDWKVHFFPYTDFPAYNNPEWIAKKKVELGRFFDQEYPSNIIDCFLASNKGFLSDITIDYGATQEEYVPNHFYSMGVDWGMSGDYTVAVVLDRTANKMVDCSRFNRMSWNLQRLELVKLAKKWKPQGIRVEENSIGSVNIEELRKDGLDIESFNTTNSSKAAIFQSLHESLENGLQLMNDDVLRSELSSLVSKQTATGLWTVSADGNSHDDFPMALALANSARRLSNKSARSWE